MKVILQQGDKLVVELADTDGVFEIEYGDRELTVKADLPDSDGREGTIYSERFAEAHEQMMQGESNGTYGTPAPKC